MIINNNSIEKLKNINFNNCYIVTDFDRTLTSEKSENSWSVISNNNEIPHDFIYERKKLYDKYRPIELNEKIEYNEKCELISEWFRECIGLFSKYKIKKDVFDKASSNSEMMDFRTGAKDFMKFLAKNKIPLIIISAGIGNFIECFLKNNNCLYDNSYIFSNKIIFKDGIAVGTEKKTIHSLNKSEVSLPLNIKKKISNKEIVILLGDQISDSKMVNPSDNKQLLKIGFYSKDTNVDIELFKEYFDIVCSEKDNYNDILNLLFRNNQNSLIAY